MPRKRDIEAAIAAYNDTPGRERLLLPPATGRLLAAMFPTDTVCHRSVGSLLAEVEGIDRLPLRRLLGSLAIAGFLSREPGSRGVRATYHLHLPPQCQPDG